MILTIRATAMHRITRKSRMDAGWFFVIGGLTLCVAGVLLPAQRDLESLQRQRDRLRYEEEFVEARLAARGVFLQQLESHEPTLIRRLAASQLNLIPHDEQPVLISSSLNDDVIHWVDATVKPAPPTNSLPLTTTLSRLMNGRYRLWLLVAGIVSAFLGLLIDPSLTRVRAKIGLAGPYEAYSALICRIDRTTLDDLIARIELLRTSWQVDFALVGRHPLAGGIVRPNRRWRAYAQIARQAMMDPS